MEDLLETLNADEMKLIQKVNLAKEQILFSEDEVCKNIGIIISGEVEIISYTKNGKEVLFNRLTEGMVFGNNLIFSSNPQYKGSVIAKRPSVIALINKQNLVKLLRNNEDFMLKYLKIQSDTGKTLNDKIKLLSLDSAEDRLLYLMRKNNVVYFKSITQLANQLYLQRETLSRLISRLEKDNKIIKSRHTIKLIS